MKKQLVGNVLEASCTKEQMTELQSDSLNVTEFYQNNLYLSELIMCAASINFYAQREIRLLFETVALNQENELKLKLG